MKKLSVALAVFNEEENLGKCLESVRDIADEVVIVDGGSSDKTLKIAKEFNAKIIHANNPPIFHINKQKAIDASSGKWVLQLDADEVVSKELASEIKEIINSENEDCNGFWMSRKNYFLGTYLMKGGQFPDYTLRLYRKGKGKLPQRSVHEQAEVEGKVGYLKFSLLHYPYKNFSVYIEKWWRYNHLLKNEIKTELKNKSNIKKSLYAIGYLGLKPAHWFLTTYIRHKGFMDGWQGFVFSFYSSIRFPVSYIMYLKDEKK